MMFMSVFYKMSYDGQHDWFLWFTHMICWGQNQLFWITATIYDTDTTRMLYFRSSFATSIIPYLVMPIYLLWLVTFHLWDRDGVYTFNYFIVSFVLWFIYLIISKQYSTIILSSLYNYWMLLEVRSLEKVWEKQSRENLCKYEDRTTEFDERCQS